MDELTKEQVYKKIKLTKKQNEAWEELMKAFKRCEKSGLFFYTVLETIYGLDGNNVENIEGCDDLAYNSPLCPSSHILPQYLNFGLGGFADDRHKIVLKE